MEFLPEIVTAALSFVIGAGGSGLIAYLKFAREGRNEQVSFIEKELSNYKNGYDTLRTEVAELRMAIVPSSAPEWRKDSSRNYVYVSPSYEIGILFPIGLTINDILGKKDDEIFSKFPEFIKILRSIDDEAQQKPERMAIRKNVIFPGGNNKQVIIKEIAQAGGGSVLFVGRAYPSKMFDAL